MFAVIVAIIVLIAAVGAIYLLLKSMGQDGVEVAAPGSCKRGRCGVRAAPPVAGEATAVVVESTDTAALPAPELPRVREPLHPEHAEQARSLPPPSTARIEQG